MPTGKYNRKRKETLCHPKEPHYAKGFCRNCYVRIQTRNWRLNNLDYSRKIEFHRAIERRYGLTQEAFWKLWDSQGGRCALCTTIGFDTEAPRNVLEFKLVVDHDHKTGKVRGLLCQRCNISLGGYEFICNNQLLKPYLEQSPVDRAK